jgi:L-ribulose-5-phosphate 3-epimerase
VVVKPAKSILEFAMKQEKTLPPSRREFTRSAAMTAAAALLPSLKAAEFDYPWKLGIITDEVNPDLSVTLSDFYPKYSLKWAELRNVKLDGKSRYLYKTATPQQAKAVRKQLDDAGVKVSVLDTGVYKIALPGTKPLGENARDLNPEQGEFGRQLEDLKRAAELAHILGTGRVRIFTFKRVAQPDQIFDRIVEELNKALTVAKAADTVLVIENEFDCNTGTGAESAKLFKAISDRRLMHNWDPGNCYEAGEKPFPDAWNQLDHSRISHIHLKDAKGKNWMPIGAGEIDFVGQFEALKKIRYTGTLSLETHYKNPRNDPFQSSVESMDGLVRTLRKV